MAGRLAITDTTNPYFIDSLQRTRDLQAKMQKQGIDVYIGTRPRTLTWIADVFIPWRSYLIIPVEGMPTLFTFFVDRDRIASETWIEDDRIIGYFGGTGLTPVPNIAALIRETVKGARGRIGFEDGISVFTPEGYLTKHEYDLLTSELPDAEFVDVHGIIDGLSLIKDQGTINRFREAGRICDIGHEAVRAAVSNGGYKKITETEVGGIAALVMRKAGSVSEWNFAGLNEIATGWRTSLGACTPPTTKKLAAGEPCMFDMHSLFMLAMGDHAHNYLIAPATKRQRWHADNFVALVELLLKSYETGKTPAGLLEEVIELAKHRGCDDYLLPAVEHGIGLWGDEWKIGAETNQEIPYWTDPTHAYQENEMVIAAMQYVCPADEIGFRYENPILIQNGGCELMSIYPFGIEEIE
jgi:Xaa-Pro aminopeptidase